MRRIVMSEISKLDQNLIVKKIDSETVNVQITDNEMLMSIVGQFDQNLKNLAKETKTNIFFRGNSITCKGNKASTDMFCEAVRFLINKYLLTKIIEKEDIISSVKKNTEFETSNVKSFNQLIKTPRKSVIARSEKQTDYIKALRENEIVMSLGPAGTGKSFLAVSVAVNMLMEKKIDRVILSRPAVEAGEKLGFLPGDMKEKVDPYLRPLYDALYELFGADKIDKKIDSGEIEIAPLAFMRGRTLKNCFAILDEAQNATETQIKMFLTRIGENSKLVVNGDPSQIDLINKSQSGLIKSKKILKHLKEIKIIEFDHKDVVRHPLVSKIIRAYQRKALMIKINVISNNAGWARYLKRPDIYIEKRIKNLNQKNGKYKKKDIHCTLLLSGSSEIKKLNKKFRNKNKSTDVLSFPFYSKKKLMKKLKTETEIYLGDIIVNLNKIKNKKNIKDFKLEFNKLWIHGLIHLFGHDHKKIKDFDKMIKIENKFLSYLN